jgi:hypothetical protein
VSTLAWLSPEVLVSGAEDGSLQGWVLKESSLQSLWLLSTYQKSVLGLATSQELLASASGTADQWVSLFLNMLLPPLNLYYIYTYVYENTHSCNFLQLSKCFWIYLSSIIILDSVSSYSLNKKGLFAGSS